MGVVRLAPAQSCSHLPAIDIEPGQSKTVGRADHADVRVNDASLSRLHARLSRDAQGDLTIQDLGSTNGVRVNGARIQIAQVRPGDVVCFGEIGYVAMAAGDADGTGSMAPQTVIRRVAVDTAPPVDRLALEALLATSRELMAFADLPALLDRVLDRFCSIAKPDRAAILLVEPSTGALVPRAVRPPGAYRSVSDVASATVVREALAARTVFVVHDIQMDARLQQAVSVVAAGVKSVICVPLFGRAGPIGALYADRLGLEQFPPGTAEYAAAFAGHAATALETAQLYEDRERLFRGTLEAFATALEARDPYIAGHSQRVTAYTVVLARAAGMPESELDVIRRAGMLHDIGKVGVPDAALLKAGPLDSEERAAIERHVTIGHRMLQGLPFLQAALPSVRGHHERWDGSGYPDRLAGADIHPHAQLMAVADSFDAMTSARPYRHALSVEEAAARLRNDKGTHFAPAAIDAYDAVERELDELAARSRLSAVPT